MLEANSAAEHISKANHNPILSDPISSAAGHPGHAAPLAAPTGGAGWSHSLQAGYRIRTPIS
ncbi:MAG: hypothetical protein ACRDLV_15190, partial [Solirubrobacteraceae bacterium]